MKITNNKEFEKVCTRRGWTSEAYAAEVEEHAMTTGDFGVYDIYGDYRTSGGRCLSERFLLVYPAVIKIENEETRKLKTYRGCDEIPPGWFYAYEKKPAAYRFEPDNEITRYVIEENKRRKKR